MKQTRRQNIKHKWEIFIKQNEQYIMSYEDVWLLKLKQLQDYIDEHDKTKISFFASLNFPRIFYFCATKK